MDDQLFDTSPYIKVRHPDDMDVYPKLMDSPVEDDSSPVNPETVHPLYSSDTTGELTGERTGELAHRGNHLYQWTETYERRNHTYVRYCYSLNQVTGSKRTIHIPGGNAHTQRLRERWVQVETLVQRGKTPEEITRIIADWH